jgi:Predicted membrane protein (DUF2157)
MDNSYLLDELIHKIASGEIDKSEVLQRISQVSLPGSREVVFTSKHAMSYYITKMLYALGAIVVVLGIIIFVGQLWEDLSSVTRIIITFGLGILFTGAGSALMHQSTTENLGKAFHFMGGMLIPGGAVVILEESGLGNDTALPAALIFSLLTIFFMALNTIHKHAILTFFCIAHATIAAYLLTTTLIEGQFGVTDDIYIYLTMILGVSYLLLARAFSETWNKSLSNMLYVLGSGGFLGAAFLNVIENEVWQLFYFALVGGCLWTAVHLRSRIVLVMSMLFLVIHISYITSEYFADSIGWPIALVFLGFMFIGLGYLSISINNKYISSAE